MIEYYAHLLNFSHLGPDGIPDQRSWHHRESKFVCLYNIVQHQVKHLRLRWSKECYMHL